MVSIDVDVECMMSSCFVLFLVIGWGRTWCEPNEAAVNGPRWLRSCMRHSFIPAFCCKFERCLHDFNNLWFFLMCLAGQCGGHPSKAEAELV